MTGVEKQTYNGKGIKIRTLVLEDVSGVTKKIEPNNFTN
jgi:hypothetical protein